MDNSPYPLTSKPGLPDRSDSSSSSSVDHQEMEIHTPVPTRPRLHSRKSSGTLIVPRDSFLVGPSEPDWEPDDVRAMSPRRTSEDLENLGREAREELQRHASALQDSLLMIFHRIEAVKEEHDKLDNNNKFLQKYIGDLMSTTIADARPDALVQVEPKGPLFREKIFSSEFSRPWGLTSIPLAYEPYPNTFVNASSMAPLATRVVVSNSTENRMACVLQAEQPARQLPTLAKVPILIDKGEASYQNMYDYCFAKFLR
ncbi:Uu.00g037410.m01.CDS01 [Anthostomella pinea]|uniref:Uu.00g037410.m01.CDS01 n=1 Tax=Anthostomella pinea TaxID=933095 RepID=A0AAI8V4P7_9PEZI|nr:Uu.00g037410.m01.CDS01 [Anthostomella pinea]